MKRTYKPKGNRRNSNYKKRRHNNSGQKIAHSRYISKAQETSYESPYINDITFAQLNLDPVVLRNVQERKYKRPTRIQGSAIPEIMAGNDVIGLANTGSGKTGAFLLPLITKVLRERNNRCLIIAPTRELASQIYHELKLYAKDTRAFGVLIVGGVGYGPQLNLLSRNPQFVIATPGRLIDLYKQNKINLKELNNVVLDEVDTMLDMGFVKDIEFIISKLPKEKQALVFSATMNPKTERIANSILRNPVKIQETTKKVSLNIDQSIRKYQFNGERINMLAELIKSNKYGKFLVFARTRRGTDSLTKELLKRGHKSAALHGNKTQGQRNKVVSLFRKNRIDILVATDVASRGIDIKNITHVINFDEPATYDDYIHRIGRTGRIGKKGTAITFVR